MGPSVLFAAGQTHLLRKEGVCSLPRGRGPDRPRGDLRAGHCTPRPSSGCKGRPFSLQKEGGSVMLRHG